MKIVRKLPVFAAVALAASLCLTSCASDEFDDFLSFGKSLNEFFPSEDDYNDDSDEIDKGISDTIDALSTAMEKFTPQDEYFIGRTVAASILEKYPLYKGAPRTQQYLNQICTAITVNSPLPYLYNKYCVGILDTDEITAYSTPGGHIFVSRGLIACANSEDALAAAIAHEVAHIQLKHNISAISASRFKNAGLTGAETIRKIVNSENQANEFKPEFIKNMEDDLWQMKTELVSNLLDSGFSQSQEYDADDEALKLLHDAGYDPSALIDILQAMKENTDSSIKNKGWFKTHPSPDKRIKNTTRMLKKYKNNLYDRAPREARFAEYTK